MQTFSNNPAKYELTAYEDWQLKKHGYIIKKDSNAFNNTRPKSDEDEQKVNTYFELQNIEHENN